MVNQNREGTLINPVRSNKSKPVRSRTPPTAWQLLQRNHETLLPLLLFLLNVWWSWSTFSCEPVLFLGLGFEMALRFSVSNMMRGPQILVSALLCCRPPTGCCRLARSLSSLSSLYLFSLSPCRSGCKALAPCPFAPPLWWSWTEPSKTVIKLFLF